MPLTSNVIDTVKSRIERDSAFRDALLVECDELMRHGESATAQAVLRDYLNPRPSRP